MRMLMVLYYIVYISVWVPSAARETLYMDEWCGGTYSISSAPDIRVKLTKGSSYRAYMDCSFTLYGTYNSQDKLMVNFQGDSKYCGFDTPYSLTNPYGVYTSPENGVTFLFKSDNSTESSGFDVIVTHYADATGFCNTGETECDNGRCIDASLACNGDNPCGDYSDCGDYDGSYDLDVVWVDIGVPVGATVCFILIVICCLLCKQKRDRARRQHQGHVIMTTAPVATVGSPQQQVYGQPQCHVNIYTGPVTSFPAQNTTSFSANKPTTSDYM